MKKNEDELRASIRQQQELRDNCFKSAKEFMNDNADSGTLIKHCEAKITRAIGEKNATQYAMYTYIMGLATGQNLEKLFDEVDQEAPGDESPKQGGLSGKTTPEGEDDMYMSKYVRVYPSEAILTQQSITILGNGSENQYMGQFPTDGTSKWMRRFIENQLKVKELNAELSVEREYARDKRVMPEIPGSLLATCAEAELTRAMEGFQIMDQRHRRETGLNFEQPGSTSQTYEYEQYVDIVVRPILGDRQGISEVDSNTLYNISKSLMGRGRHSSKGDGWIDIRTAVQGHSMRNVLLAMMQGEKPRYEIRIINNLSGGDIYDDLDIKILKYRMLQGHFSRMRDGREAEGTDPKLVSTLYKVVFEEPDGGGPRMRYGYHASSLSLRAFESVVEKGLVPGGQSEGDWAIRDSVHLCPLYPTHNDAVGIWGLDRPVKERNRHEGFIVQAIFVVDLLMLQEEYEVSIYQARSGNYLIPSVVPWNCIIKVINTRGSAIDMWNGRVQYGWLDPNLDAERLLSERQKKRTRTNDAEFEERRQKMDREEYANMHASSASAQKPKAPPPPPTKAPPPTATTGPPPPPPKKAPPTMPPSGATPPTGEPSSSSGAAASSSTSSPAGGVQFGFTQVPKPPPPMHMKGAVQTKVKPLGEIIGTTWSGCYGEMFSDSNQDAYNIPENHVSNLVWPKKDNKTKNCFAITSSFNWKSRGPTIVEAQKNLYLSLEGPLQATLESGEVYSLPITGTPERLSGYIGPSLEAYDLVCAFDYLLGFMLDHESDLLERVKQNLENRLAMLTNQQLVDEGTAWFGWNTGRLEHNPAHF
eukprot:2474965-Amphidinium_carterae.1